MVSTLGLLNGLTSCGIIFFGTFFGILCLYEAKKYTIKLLAFAGLACITIGCLWLGPVADFFSIVITGHNLKPLYLYSILSYMWIPLGMIPSAYLGGELILPKLKWYIIGFYIVLAIIFELFLWIDTENVFILTLNNPGEDLIDASFNRSHPCYYLVIIFLVSVFLFQGIGFIIKAIQSTGILKKKFVFLSMGFNTFVICGVFDALFAPGTILFIGRLFMMTFALWMYLGLREEPEQKVKLKAIKDITVEGSLFRISHTRSEEITEEEITFYKEQKICLVCKGSAIRYIYICPKCETLYCEHCARTVENTENACWYCGIPFDESKPTRPYNKEEAEVVDIEEGEQHPKKIHPQKK